MLVGSDGSRSSVRKQRCPPVTYDDVGITTTAGVVLKNNVPPRIQSLLAQSLVRFLGDQGHTILFFEVREVKLIFANRLTTERDVNVTL